MDRLRKPFHFLKKKKKKIRSSNGQPAASTPPATIVDDTGGSTPVVAAGTSSASSGGKLGDKVGQTDTPVSVQIPSSEKERIGLFELSKSDTVKAVDVVAVHGLQGDAYKTWTHENHTLWLRDMLPTEVPSARIMTFGYESAWAFSNSVAGIEHKARDLLNRLSAKRNDDTYRRPIVFICHSLGGIVVKKALILAHQKSSDFHDILTNTKAIAFLAVPHKGSGAAWWGNFAANVLKGASVGLSTNSALLADLRKDSSALTDIQKQSIERIQDLKMYTFYETLKLQNVLVVDELSALLNLPNERTFPVHADHRTICKIPSKDDQLYEAVVVWIAKLIKSTIGESVHREDQLPSSAISIADVSKKLVDLLKAKSNLLQDTTDLSLPIPISESPEYVEWASGETSNILWYRGKPGVGKSVMVSHTLKRLFESLAFTKAIAFFDFDIARKLDRPSANVPGLVISLIIAQLSDRNPKLFATVSIDEQKTVATALLGSHEILTYVVPQESDVKRVMPGLVSALRTVSEETLWTCLGRFIDEWLKKMPQIYLIFDGDDVAIPEDRFRFLRNIRELWERSRKTQTGCLKVLIASRDYPKAREILDGLPYLDNEKEQQECVNSLRLGAANDRMDRIGSGAGNTGKWILRDPQYCEWREEPGSALLWLQGNPGTGKSTLMKQIKTQLEKELRGSNAVIASYYYSAREGKSETSHTHMLQALLHQILIQDTENTYPFFRSIFRTNRERMQPWQYDEMQSIFVSIFRSASRSDSYYLLLDALDESDRDGIPETISLLQEVIIAEANLKVLVASRPSLHISNGFANSEYHLVLEEKNQKDIERVIASSLEFLQSSDRTTFEWIARYILDHARGVFLWVTLVVSDVKRLLLKGWSEAELRSKVKGLPDSLIPYYQSITTSLADQARHEPAILTEGITTLHWIVYSERPLTVAELRDVLATSSIRNTMAPFSLSSSNFYSHRFKKLEHVPKRLMSNCGELVEVKRSRQSATASADVSPDISSEDIVQLFHETVREFLKDSNKLAAPFHMEEIRGHEEIAIICAQYIRLSVVLDSHDNEDKPPTTESPSSWNFEKHRLFAQHLSDRHLVAYALKCLPRHMDYLEDQGHAKSICLEYFQDLNSGHESLFLRNWLQFYSPRLSSNLPKVDADEASRFLVRSMAAAAEQGLATAVMSLIEAQTTLDAVDDTTNHSALQLAAKEGHDQVINLLIDNEASVNFHGGYFADDGQYTGTALQAAAYSGHTAVAKLLLARGADPNSESGYLVTAFMAAYCMGHMETADLLRAAGADPYPPPALFCHISSASELNSLVQNVIVGSSDCDRGILRAAATQYSKMGQTSSSEEMGLLALKKTEIMLGDGHPETLRCGIFLAQLFVLHNKNEKAEAVARRALEGLGIVLGPKHPDTLQVSLTLAEILGKQGKWGEAEKIASLALDGMSRIFGPESLQTLQTFNTLIEILEKQGKSEEAAKLKRDFGVKVKNQTIESTF